MKCFKNVPFLPNELIGKMEIIKTLLQAQTYQNITVSKPSAEEEKEEVEVSPTRNEIIKEIQWQKQLSGKENENEPINIYIGNISFDTKIDDLHEIFSLRSAKYLRQMCKINMSVNEKTGKCKSFTFTLAQKYVQKEIFKLIGITSENRVAVMEDLTYLYEKTQSTQGVN